MCRVAPQVAATYKPLLQHMRTEDTTHKALQPKVCKKNGNDVATLPSAGNSRVPLSRDVGREHPRGLFLGTILQMA